MPGLPLSITSEPGTVAESDIGVRCGKTFIWDIPAVRLVDRIQKDYRRARAHPVGSARSYVKSTRCRFDNYSVHGPGGAFVGAGVDFVWCVVVANICNLLEIRRYERGETTVGLDLMYMA